jgi:Undecaprenyl-phosphate galactose phosphotransferase WbaP
MNTNASPGAVIAPGVPTKSEIASDFSQVAQLSTSHWNSRRALVVCQFVGYVFADLLGWVTAGYLSHANLFGSTSTGSSGWLLAMGVWFAWFGFGAHAYTRRYAFWSELGSVVAASSVLVVAGFALHWVTTVQMNPVSLFSLSVYLAFFTPTFRAVTRNLLHLVRLWDKPTIVFGSGENAYQAYLALRSEPAMGYHVVAFAAPGELQRTMNSVNTADAPPPCLRWVGHQDDIRCLRHFSSVIALEADEYLWRDTLIRQVTQHQVNDVQVIPAMRGVPLYGLETRNFFSHEVLMIQVRNKLALPLFQYLKRIFDLGGSSVLLLLLSPVFAYIGYKVRQDGGSAFFGHTRIGQNGKPFKCYKFRSMVMNAEAVLKELLASSAEARAEWDKDFKLKNDPRISKIGQFIRKTSLDELPQLWNVFIGEMSLVGPRPVVQAELERYGLDVEYYLLAKPGMTGLWQVSGRNDVDYATRVYLDSWYVKNWSLWTDVAILFKTIRVVLGKSGAY